MWTEVPLTVAIVKGKRTYRAQMDAPSDGRWVAFFIDIKYEKEKLPGAEQGLGGLPHDRPGQLEFTTEVSVWPNSFPYEDCYADTCIGPLV